MRALIVCITLLFAFLTCTMAQIPSVKVENAKGAQVNTSSLVNHKTPMIIARLVGRSQIPCCSCFDR